MIFHKLTKTAKFYDNISDLTGKINFSELNCLFLPLKLIEVIILLLFVKWLMTLVRLVTVVERKAPDSVPSQVFRQEYGADIENTFTPVKGPGANLTQPKLN